MSRPFVIKSEDRIYGTSDDFITALKAPIKTAKLSLVHFFGPNLIPTINNTNDTIDCFVGGENRPLTVPHGIYILDSLRSTIVNLFVDTFGDIGTTCVLDPRTLRLTIATSSADLAILWKTGPNAHRSVGKVLGFVQDSPAGLSHTSHQPPNLASPQYLYISFPQYSPIGVDTANNKFDFAVPITANSGGDCRQFFEYAPPACLVQEKVLPNINLVGIPTDLEVRVTTSTPGFDLNGGEWTAHFRLE